MHSLRFSGGDGKLSKDPLGPASPLPHGAPVHTLDTNNAHQCIQINPLHLGGHGPDTL